jgi:hypothetical protein
MTWSWWRVPAKRTPPFAAYPKWTEARFWGFLRSALRTASTRWPPRYEVVHDAKRVYKGENKRQKYEYQCAHCKDWHPQKEVEVDHIVPVGSLKCFEDLPGFCERLFCSKEGLRLLCKLCHRKVTNKEVE